MPEPDRWREPPDQYCRETACTLYLLGVCDREHPCPDCREAIESDVRAEAIAYAGF